MSQAIGYDGYERDYANDGSQSGVDNSKQLKQLITSNLDQLNFKSRIKSYYLYIHYFILSSQLIHLYYW